MKKESQEVLGIRIDLLKPQEVMEKISQWIKEGGFHYLVTVYSEFVVKAGEDEQFKEVLEEADLAVADGAGVLAAARYADRIEGKGAGGRLIEGLRVGWRGLRGKNGQPVTGVWLSEQLVREAAINGWRVFLLGGFGKRVQRLAGKFRREYPGLRIEWDPGEQKVGEEEEKNKQVINKIRKFKPDVLLVAYGPVKQEKWIYENKDRLPAKVAVGVGGTFDELTGKVKPAPDWVEKHGLKSFWRLIQEPKRIKRMKKAWLVFPWRVFKEA